MKFLDSLTEDIINRDAYEYFKKNKKFKHESTDDFFKWQRVIKGLVKYLTILNYKSNSGVYLKDVGYFACVPISKKEGIRMSLVRRRPDKIYMIRKFYPDNPKADKWFMDEVVKDVEPKNVKLMEAEFYKNQNRYANYINKRANIRGRS